MDNNDFDNLFSDQLNQEQDFNFQESDWEDLNERMAGQKGRRRFILPFWLSLAGAVLLGSIFYLWYANRLTNNELDALRTEITKLNEEQLTDTVYKEIIVYRTDTIYQNSEFQISSKKDQLQTSNRQPKKLNKDLKPPQTDTSEGQRITSVKEEQLKTANQKPGNSATEGQRITSASEELYKSIIDLPKIPLFAQKETKFPILDYVAVEQKKKPAKKRNKIDFGGQIGATAGWGYADIEQSSAYNAAATNGIGKPNVINRNSYSAGIQGELHMDDKMRLTSSVFYERLKVEVDNYQAIENIPNAETLEDIQASSADLQEYNNAGVLQQTLNYEFGIKYAFESKNKWRPYLGAGILGQSSLKRNIKYSSSNIDYLAYSVQLDNRSAEVSTKPVFFYGLRATAGTEFSISDHFGLQVEGYYNYNYKTFDDRHLNLFGARAGVYFKF